MYSEPLPVRAAARSRDNGAELAASATAGPIHGIKRVAIFLWAVEKGTSCQYEGTTIPGISRALLPLLPCNGLGLSPK